MVKGDNHTVVNNLALDRHSDDGKCSLCVIYILRHDSVIENNNTVVLNNGASQADGGRNVDTGGRWPMAGGVQENNYSNMDIKEQVVAPGIRDFRPVLGGALDVEGSTIGPYSRGTDSLSYWIPGRREYKASKPIPPPGSTVEASRDALMFQEAYKADTHHFYFGLSEEEVTNAGPSDPEFQFSLEDGNMIALPELSSNTHYFWRIDAQRGGYLYQGDVWDFVTM